MHLALFTEKNHLWAVILKFTRKHGGNPMKLTQVMQITTATLFMALAVNAADAAKGGKGNEWPGPNDPVFTVESYNFV